MHKPLADSEHIFHYLTKLKTTYIFIIIPLEKTKKLKRK